jgi:catechol 2,3-dioxygenase-like lactoylglutathione lyase family enzyme
MHLHLNVSSRGGHEEFWTRIGGAADAIGPGRLEIIRFPNALILMTDRAPSGGTKGSSVNHVAFGVQNIRAMVDTLKAAGYPIVTRAEMPPAQEVVDDLAYVAVQQNHVAFVMGPDDTKVELFEVREQPTRVAIHHVHFASPQVEEMRAWYVEVFGATPGMRGVFKTADLPGINLSWSPAPPGVAGTEGRVLDRIGFEVNGLERFCRKLEGLGIALERPYGQVPALGIAAAFTRDPWGTRIELTEGLVVASRESGAVGSHKSQVTIHQEGPALSRPSHF